MEKTKTIDLSNRPKDIKEVNPSCPYWIFGNKNSANNDLEKKFEVIDEENQSNSKTVSHDK